MDTAFRPTFGKLAAIAERLEYAGHPFLGKLSARRQGWRLLIDSFAALEAPIRELDAEINRRSKADPVAQRLMTIPGVGPIAATAITALVPAAGSFRAGRDFAAWLGLPLLQKSTGG